MSTLPRLPRPHPVCFLVVLHLSSYLAPACCMRPLSRLAPVSLSAHLHTLKPDPPLCSAWSPHSTAIIFMNMNLGPRCTRPPAYAQTLLCLPPFPVSSHHYPYTIPWLPPPHITQPAFTIMSPAPAITLRAATRPQLLWYFST
ncbi:hypothetical protein C8R44DRAFT_880504 [Mycena epipterygia]|nr:hypothetical protein C8R44DRAFT_880504 [Mycena epipterygia]